MSISLQTNYASLVAQNNLSTTSNFQTKTIEALTSGYRINSSGDDAAGLAVANKYRSSIAELTQGVMNANDGVSSLQIVDGGLNNITMMLDRLKTLATQSASTTFTGDRANINVEYQQLVRDISRQAANIGLDAGGKFNVVNNVYIGGSDTAANAQVMVDLSGTDNQVDANGLALANTSVLGGGTELSGNSIRMDAPGATFLATKAQNFTFNVISNNSATSVSVSVGGSGALTANQVITALNSQLEPYHITAQVGSDGQLQFGGTAAFTVSTTTTATDAIATTTASGTNGGVYEADGQTTYAGAAENLTFQNGQGTAIVALTAADTAATAVAKINAQTSSLGIYAVLNAAGTGISFQSVNSFTASSDTAAGTFTASGPQTVNSPNTTASVTGDSLAAIDAINAALKQIGFVQARVGAGQNKLQYAIDLANNQVTNFSAAQSRIRDADVAKEAANMTKAQVLQQATIAAMAQANSAPQAVLSLLKG